jgi:hypothetical protein
MIMNRDINVSLKGYIYLSQKKGVLCQSFGTTVTDIIVDYTKHRFFVQHMDLTLKLKHVKTEVTTTGNISVYF